MSMQRDAQANAPLKVFELRNYRTQPGRRDDLIAMFEAHFLDAYTRGGTTVIGTFRNADDPDRWFWIRAFPDLASRPERLKGFYSSQDWLSRADACNATIADVSDALLMRMVAPPAIALPMTPEMAAIKPAPATAQIELLFFPLRLGQEAKAADWFASQAAPALTSLGQPPTLALVPQSLGGLPNRQPLRNDPVLAVFIRHGSAAAFDTATASRAESGAWKTAEERISASLGGAVERRRLLPTDRSWFR